MHQYLLLSSYFLSKKTKTTYLKRTIVLLLKSVLLKTQSQGV